jgi:hypothetical protein
VPRFFARYTLAFALKLRKKHGKTSVRVAKISVRVEKPQSGDECSPSLSARLNLGESVAIVHRSHWMGPKQRPEILKKIKISYFLLESNSDSSIIQAVY